MLVDIDKCIYRWYHAKRALPAMLTYAWQMGPFWQNTLDILNIYYNKKVIMLVMWTPLKVFTAVHVTALSVLKKKKNCFSQVVLFTQWNPIITHWGQVTHICVGNLTIIGSDNGLSPGRRQAIIWTNAGILSIGTNFSEILIKNLKFFSRKCIRKCRLENGAHLVSASMW